MLMSQMIYNFKCKWQPAESTKLLINFYIKRKYDSCQKRRALPEWVGAMGLYPSPCDNFILHSTPHKYLEICGFPETTLAAKQDNNIEKRNIQVIKIKPEEMLTE